MSLIFMADAGGASQYTTPYLVLPGHSTSEATSAWAPSSVVLGFEIEFGSVMGNSPFLAFRNDPDIINHNQFWVNLQSNGELVAIDYTGNIFVSQTRFGYPNEVLFANTRHFVEVSVSSFAGAATVVIRIDGVQVMSAVGDTTNGSAYLTHVWINGPFGSHIGVVWADTDTFYGDLATYAFRPSSDIATEWTPLSGGENWPEVDDVVSDGDVSYVHAWGAAEDELGVSGATPAVQSVVGVQVGATAREQAAGGGTLAVEVVSGGNASMGLDRALSSGYADLYESVPTDPGTAAAWADLAAVAAAHIRYRRN